MYFYMSLAILVVMLVLFFSTGLKQWVEFHLHRKRELVLVDSSDLMDLLAYYGAYIKSEDSPSPFTSNSNALVVSYIDVLGRTVAQKVRWMDGHYYYINIHWLDLLEKYYPVADEPHEIN